MLGVYESYNKNIKSICKTLQEMINNEKSIEEILKYIFESIKKVSDNKNIEINKNDNTNNKCKRENIKKDKSLISEKITKNGETEDLYQNEDLSINQNKILNMGLKHLLEKEKIKNVRYFELSLDEDEYEKRLKKNPNDIELWIRFTKSVLPPEISINNFNKLGSKLDKALNVLSRSLEVNQKSYPLWNLYMEIYLRRAADDSNDIKEIFEQGLTIIPKAVWFWWMYYDWENDIDNKLNILSRMLRFFTIHSKGIKFKK